MVSNTNYFTPLPGSSREPRCWMVRWTPPAPERPDRQRSRSGSFDHSCATASGYGQPHWSCAMHGTPSPTPRASVLYWIQVSPATGVCWGPCHRCLQQLPAIILGNEKNHAAFVTFIKCSVVMCGGGDRVASEVRQTKLHKRPHRPRRLTKVCWSTCGRVWIGGRHS